ncbi:EFR1 family ferrodoxin [Clostridium tepidum]|jgi:ferredoxin/menaquinone-dependent protoporphyrinogen IX oxidase|uniref:(Fe-S)-binding protein n=1 Tax=Clostridium tepidum TaxID=1962263 RepID=A0A1S9I0D0_9CLOT|nr:EFR1 family ferrodoxin [Clostridium tepidum]MCR1935643.1 EFR1 family ferrodoxin [Clostridium tepidum]MDU6879018.1 EFR1 family ferrodoxin [Clostridium botulinum]OOO61351.1 (Fe-S)-binding protein [Clostridium tepidum]OOO63801.1 (Fe-S)-binding protein [Clostridium tepidum]
MNGILFYFSGTGNTKWVADKIENKLSKLNNTIHKVNIENIDDDVLNNIDNYDFIIIGTPIYAEMGPKLINDFANSIPKVKKRIKCILYSTQGGNTACAVENIHKILHNKGYDVVIKANIKMINNYYFSIGKKPDKVEIENILKDSEKKVEVIIDKFLKGEKYLEKVSKTRLFFGKIASKGFNKILPKFSNNLKSTDYCTKCGMCVRNCPKGNIVFENGGVVFHSNCMLCLRCIYICPNNAIFYKEKRIDQIEKNMIKFLDIK